MTGLNVCTDEIHPVPCEYDYSWLIYEPSSLLWADKIIITPAIEKMIKDGFYPDNGGRIAKTLNITFETADEFGLLEVKNPNEILTDNLQNKIEKEIELDKSVLSKLFPKQVKVGDDKNVPGEISIEGYSYCTPRIFSIYSSLILADNWKAQCLFSKDYINYCKYKFGSSLFSNSAIKSKNSPLNTIFNLVMPEKEVFTYYSFGHQCDSCKNLTSCGEGYEKQLRDDLYDYLEFRDYEWVSQIKSILMDIISRLENNHEEVNDEQIMLEFRKEQRNAKKMVYKVFPKVRRWANISLIASVPTSFVGLASGLPCVTITGAAMAGVSEIAKEIINHSESKYKWVGFVKKGSVNKKIQ